MKEAQNHKNLTVKILTQDYYQFSLFRSLLFSSGPKSKNKKEPDACLFYGAACQVMPPPISLPPIHSHLQQTLFWTLEENKYQTLHKKMKFSITDFLFNYDQIRRKLMRALIDHLIKVINY